MEAFRVLAPASRPPAGALTVAQLRLHRPEWVVVSDFQYEDSERLRARDPSYSDAVLALMGELRAAYDLAEEFRPRPRLGPNCSSSARCPGCPTGSIPSSSQHQRS